MADQFIRPPDERWARQLQHLDTEIFEVPSQTGPGDRKSLLTLQSIVRSHLDRYIYLEIGSHLGGTLTPHLLDSGCRFIYSVDKRPASQLDERGVYFDYPSNSSSAMIDVLRKVVPESSLLKLVTIDSDMSDVADDEIVHKADFVLIDGEHTNTAVFRDFVKSLRFIKSSAVVAFHDANLVFDGLLNIEQFLSYQKIAFRSFFLPDCVFAISLGDFAHLTEQPLQRIGYDRKTFLEGARASLWKQVAANAALIEGSTIGHRTGV